MQGRRVWALAPEDNADLQYLRASGCQGSRCGSIENADRDTIRAGMQACDAVLLMGDVAANCRAAWLARDMALPLDLVAFVGPARRGELTALLRVEGTARLIARPGAAPSRHYIVLPAALSRDTVQLAAWLARSARR